MASSSMITTMSGSAMRPVEPGEPSQTLGVLPHDEVRHRPRNHGCPHPPPTQSQVTGRSDRDADWRKSDIDFGSSVLPMPSQYAR